ncbi:hypothetical protein DPMN_190429 [Dreissena polymorpha]|nr:hypothetical protein DPMN_190429 [Dreissena polymorpha]
MRNDMVFKEIDQHSMRAPPLTKESLPRLVEYLVAYADNSFEKVRAFYVWITHNINYDTSGYFNRAPLRPTDPDSVLANRVTVCEGYCRLFAAFCSEAEIPAKIICGYAKSYGYQPGDDVMRDSHNTHAWNSVYIDNDWFLVDVTWGAGFVKSKERKYVSRFTNAYFLTDPEVFITDHFPFPVKSFERYESDTKWQLLEKPFSALEFCSVVNFDQCGKDWGIRSLTHHKAIIYNIEYEIDIELETMHTNISDFLAFLYEGERKIDNFIFACMPTDKTVRVHVCMPGRGVFTLQVYARRQRDSPRGDFQPIVKYILQCNKSFDQPLTYPTHHTLYGPVKELAKYGIDSIEQGVYHVADDGEIIFSVKPKRYIDIFPRLHFQDHTIDLKNYCFVDHSDCGMFLNVIVRLRYEGHYKLVLFGKQENSSTFTPFASYLIKCTKACIDGVFPDAHDYALKYKCCILEPLIKALYPSAEVLFCVKSPIAKSLKCNGTVLTKKDDGTFEGTVKIPGDDCTVVVEGCGLDGIFHCLYSYHVDTQLDKF